ncbi:MAG: hypothetical protein QOF89_4217 [Acidobacteriota bacterium]|jgi:hypothetical protein|nr:hypothetical protein [Acidobacteriota bacterium]
MITVSPPLSAKTSSGFELFHNAHHWATRSRSLPSQREVFTKYAALRSSSRKK